jgi:hypothetical protein
MRRWAVLLTVLVLAGCHKKPADASAADAAAPAADATAAAPDQAAKSASATPAAPAPAVPLAQLAYDYVYKLSLPAPRIQHLFDWHQQACAVAGPAVCQVVGASLQKSGTDVVSAHLELRATPDWINHFRGGLDADAQAAGGTVEAANTAAEDLTRSIVDNQAVLHSKTVLRDRLEKQVEQRSGKMSDAIEAEKSVAEVQGDIDTQRSELAAEKTRVATSKLTLDYAPTVGAAPIEAQHALHNAMGSVLGNMMTVLAFLVTLASYVFPLALVVGLVGWVAHKVARKTDRKPVDKKD